MEPRRQRDVVGIAALEGHGCVAMGVHQPRHEEFAPVGSCEFATEIERSSGYKIGNALGRFCQSFKEEVLNASVVRERAITSESEKMGITSQRDTLPCSFIRFVANYLRMS